MVAETPKIEPVELPDPVDWIEEHFYIPETKQPIVLVEYQKAVIREALSKDGDLFKYSTVLYSDIKKSAKSTIAGAVALYLAWHNPFETVRIVANDLKQADSRTFRAIENAIRLHPDWMNECKINNYEITLLHNNTTIQAVPVDPKGEAGGGDLITCFTELWAYKNVAAKQLWVETALSPLKFGKSIRWCETYAGYDGESPILEQLFEEGVKNGTPVDVGIEGLELTRNKRMLALWNTKARCYWQTPEYYAHEATQYTPNEFSRIHENKWARSTDAFVPAEWWDACEMPYPEFGMYTPMIIAIDAGVDSDLFAMVGLSRVDGVSYVRYVNAWVPPKNGKIDFTEPLRELERLALSYNLEGCCFDPYQLHMFSGLVQEKGIVYMREFPQGAKRLEADKGLYDAIRERRIRHNGNDLLTQHVQNANRESAAENKLRIVKRTADKKIDVCVALSMANHTAVELQLG